jgi:hypothetical protein
MTPSELQRVLGAAGSGPCTITPAIRTTTSRGGGADRGDSHVVLCATEGDDDEGNFETFEEHAFEGDGEGVPVERSALRVGAEERDLGLVDRFFVV